MVALQVTIGLLLVASASGRRTSLQSSATPQQDETVGASLLQLYQRNESKPSGTGWLDTDFIHNDGNPSDDLAFNPVPSPPPAPGAWLENDFLHNDGNPADALAWKQQKANPAPAAATPAAATPAAAPAPAKKSASAAQIGVTKRSKDEPAKKEAAEPASASEPAAEASNASEAPASNTTTSNSAEESSTNKSADESPVTCVTRADPRITAWFIETAPDGTPCVFGVDVRDEGSHCIYDDGQFGSNGFCFTRADGSQWGSCNSECPLYGPAAALGKKLDHVAKVVKKIETAVNSSKSKDAKASAASLAQVSGRAQPLLHLHEPTDANASAISVGKGGTGVVVIPLQSQRHPNAPHGPGVVKVA